MRPLWGGCVSPPAAAAALRRRDGLTARQALANDRSASADSTGHRNTFAESLSGRLEAERLARPLVQLSSDRVELVLRVARDVDALGQVLPEQSIGVLVAAPLPRALRVP